MLVLVELLVDDRVVLVVDVVELPAGCEVVALVELLDELLVALLVVELLALVVMFVVLAVLVL